MRNAMAAVAAADNWRNVRRDPLRSVLLPFIGSSWRDEFAGGRGGGMELNLRVIVVRSSLDGTEFISIDVPVIVKCLHPAVSNANSYARCRDLSISHAPTSEAY